MLSIHGEGKYLRVVPNSFLWPKLDADKWESLSLRGTGVPGRCGSSYFFVAIKTSYFRRCTVLTSKPISLANSSMTSPCFETR